MWRTGDLIGFPISYIISFDVSLYTKKKRHIYTHAYGRHFFASFCACGAVLQYASTYDRYDMGTAFGMENNK